MEKSPADDNYWETRYLNGDAPWDIGKISTPLKEYIDQLTDKTISILIPGCGNAYEAEYLLAKGFKNITLIDISPALVAVINEKLNGAAGTKAQIICGDFFLLNDRFDLILEQTFFCALDPVLRKDYVDKMKELLNKDGKLAGVLFNRTFEGGPPFGGSRDEYGKLFSEKFKIRVMELCHNSITPRKGTELFVIMEAN